MDEASLNWLFLDLNSYFASVEQELRAELRGRPIAIVPVMTETTCCIAVSYEARSYGIRTGFAVAAARHVCPHIEFVEARPKLYVQMHHRILAAIEECVPVHGVLSCDEFACRLMGTQRERGKAIELAVAIKERIRERAGETLRCSIGLGPNRLLAKIAAGLHKPDGLLAIERGDLPHALHGLQLRDVPGIGELMERRLHQANVRTIRELCGLSRQRMASLWGGVIGERLWLEMRGEDLPQAASQALQTISRQHILPPEQRTAEACRQVALKMLHDCVRKLRRTPLWAGGLGLAVYYQHHAYAFQADCRVPSCREGMTLQEHFLPLWAGAPNGKPSGLCVYLTHLEPAPTQELFPSKEDQRRAAAAAAMEQIHRRFGKNYVYLGSIHGAQESAPARISFGSPPPLDDF